MLNARLLALLVGFFAFLALSVPVTYGSYLYIRALPQTLSQTGTASGATISQRLLEVFQLDDRATTSWKSDPSKKPITGPKSGVSTRTDSTTCGATAAHDVVAAAAKKKGEMLKVGESYLFQVKTGLHKQLVVARVFENVEKKLYIDAAMSQLVK